MNLLKQYLIIIWRVVKIYNEGKACMIGKQKEFTIVPGIIRMNYLDLKYLRNSGSLIEQVVDLGQLDNRITMNRYGETIPNLLPGW